MKDLSIPLMIVSATLAICSFCGLKQSKEIERLKARIAQLEAQIAR